MGLVNLSIRCVGYCDVITRSRLQPINTLIDTFFSKLHAFLVEQRRRKKTNDGSYVDGAVDKSSGDQEICKSNVIVHNLWKIWKPASSGTGSYGRQYVRQNLGEA